MNRNVAAIFILLISTCTIVTAQDNVYNQKKRAKAIPPWYAERLTISGGVYLPFSSTKLQIGTLTEQGTPLNFEKNLGYSKATVSYLAQIQWRASRRSQFELSYYRINRNSNYTLDEDIVFGEDVFHAHLAINSYFNNDIYRFAYRYSLICNPKVEAGFVVGAHIIRSGVGISLDVEVTGLTLKEDLGLTAPLPDIGIWGTYVLGERWAINGELSYFRANLKKYNGHIIASSLQVKYRAVKKLDITVGYTGFDINTDFVGKKIAGNIVWGFHGPSVSAMYSLGRKRWLLH